MKQNQRLGDFTKNGIWPPSKGPLDDAMWMGIILAATIVLVPCILGMKVRAALSSAHKDGVKD